MNFNPLSLIDKALDKIIPDADERKKHKIKARELDLEGEFKPLEMAMSAVVMEAKSNDPWTSRARPSFLYVMYVFILSALPAGIIGVWYPGEVEMASAGVKSWLEAMPGELYALFGTGYLGYVKKRSDDKMVMAGKEPKKFLGLF